MSNFVSNLLKSGFQFVDINKLVFNKTIYYTELNGEIDVCLEVFKNESKWFYKFNGETNKITDKINFFNLFDFLSIKDNLKFVYVINEVGTNFYKIGFTKNVDDRFNFFKIKLPFKYSTTAIFLTENHKVLEKKIHSFFSEKRMDGEWFYLDLNDIQLLENVNNLVNNKLFR